MLCPEAGNEAFVAEVELIIDFDANILEGGGGVLVEVEVVVFYGGGEFLEEELGSFDIGGASSFGDTGDEEGSEDSEDADNNEDFDEGKGFFMGLHGIVPLGGRYVFVGKDFFIFMICLVIIFNLRFCILKFKGKK